jgi:uncharacterized protein YkwD
MNKQIVWVFILVIDTLFAQTSKSSVKVTPKSTPSVLPAETGDFRVDMLGFVNAVRANGCRCGGKNVAPVPPLKWNGQLEEAAIGHARDMARHNYFDHIGSDGSEIDTRIEQAGYKWMEVGENIAFGQQSIRQVILDWIKSPSHCFQLMNPRVQEIGAARHGKYWVQNFGKKRAW